MTVIRLRRWGPPLATALLVTAGVLAMAPPAQASIPSRAEVSATTNRNSNNVKTISKDCPAHLHVVGAGFFINGARGSVTVSALVPTPAAAPTAVKLRAVEVDPTNAKWSVTVEAVCGDVDTTVSAAKTAFNSANTKNRSAFCSGLKVIGTGYSIREPKTSKPIIGSIGMDPGLTNVTIFANEADPDPTKWSLTTLAICAPDLGQALVTATEAPPADSVSPETVDAMCPSGTESAGAGFNTRAAGNALAATLNPAPRIAQVVAVEEDPYALNWTLSTSDICL